MQHDKQMTEKWHSELFNAAAEGKQQQLSILDAIMICRVAKARCRIALSFFCDITLNMNHMNLNTAMCGMYMRE